MYFVLRILRNASTEAYSSEIFTYDNLNQAKHQFHQVLATYAYGNNANYDYVVCEIKAQDGRIVQNEVDNRIPVPQPEPEPEPEA